MRLTSTLIGSKFKEINFSMTFSDDLPLVHLLISWTNGLIASLGSVPAHFMTWMKTAQ